MTDYVDDPQENEKTKHDDKLKAKPYEYFGKVGINKDKDIFRAVLLALVLLNLSMLFTMVQGRDERQRELTSQRDLVTRQMGSSTTYITSQGPSPNQVDNEINLSTIFTFILIFGVFSLLFMQLSGRWFIFIAYFGLIYVCFLREDLIMLGFYVVCFAFVLWLTIKFDHILDSQ